MKIQSILPWEQINKRGGYTSLDVHVQIDEEFGALIVRRHRPDETAPGRFVSYHNDVRVSPAAYADRSDAIAEAERYFYAQPRFAASSQAKILNTILAQGEVAYQEGKTVFESPFVRGTTDAAQWATGWLKGYGNALMLQLVDRHMKPTLEALQATESDLRVAVSRLQAFGVIGEYMDTLATENHSTAFIFFKDFRANDVELMSRKWPGWSEFLHAKKLGPPADVPPNDADLQAQTTTADAEARQRGENIDGSERRETLTNIKSRHAILTGPGSFYEQNGGRFKGQEVMTLEEELKYIEGFDDLGGPRHIVDPDDDPR